MEIKKIGGVQKLDKDGYIINDFEIENIQPEYGVIVDEVVNQIQKALGNNLHSIYLRGSVLKGQAVKYLSDIDTYIVVDSPINEDDTKKIDRIYDSFESKYSYLNGIELIIREAIKVIGNTRLQFVLKTQSMCIFGEDLTLMFPKFKINELSYAHSFSLKKSIDKALNWLNNNENLISEEIKYTCSWIMKRLVRVGYELVMKKEQGFTRDLYYCYEGFIKYYPEYSDRMKDILYTAINPIDNKVEIIRLIDSVDKFLIKEVGNMN